MADYYKGEANALSDLIPGNLEYSEFEEKRQENEYFLNRAIDSISFLQKDTKRAANIRKKYSKLITHISNYIIGESKLHSLGKKKITKSEPDYNSIKETESCIKGLLKTNMCKKARELSDKIALQLPMKMSQTITFSSISAFHTTVQGIYILNYDKKYLSKIYKEANKTLSEGIKVMTKAAHSVCKEGSSARAFINFGGKIKYIYRFIDGEEFTTINIDKC